MNQNEILEYMSREQAIVNLAELLKAGQAQLEAQRAKNADLAKMVKQLERNIDDLETEENNNLVGQVNKYVNNLFDEDTVANLEELEEVVDIFDLEEMKKYYTICPDGYEEELFDVETDEKLGKALAELAEQVDHLYNSLSDELKEKAKTYRWKGHFLYEDIK